MTKLIQKPLKDCLAECYSERGILSYFFFRYLPKKKNFKRFINSVFPAEFRSWYVQEYVIFSELVLGPEGFGSPDGAFYFKANSERFFVFFEGKFNSTYRESLRGSYNSSGKGQIELKFRMVQSAFDTQGNFIPAETISENAELREHFQNSDVFYVGRKDGFRKLHLRDGVGRVFSDYISKCQKDNIFVLIATNDSENPFDSIEEVERPSLPGTSWVDIRRKILWIPAKEIEDATE